MLPMQIWLLFFVAKLQWGAKGEAATYLRDFQYKQAKDLIQENLW